MDVAGLVRAVSRGAALVRFLAVGALLLAGRHAFDTVVGRVAAAPAPPGTRLGDEAVLFRSALARGEHVRDPIVRWHLVQSMRFLSEDDARSDDALFGDALALGLHERDPTVRRRLLQRARLRAEAAARREVPGEAALRAFHARAPERFSHPPRVRLSQVPIAADGAAGAPLAIPRDLPPLGERELASRFGPAFARAAMALPVGRAPAPIASAFGLHRIVVHAREEGGAAPLDAVRAEVREAWVAARAERILQDHVRALRRRFGIPEPAEAVSRRP